MGLTILTKIIKIAITLNIGRKKMRKLEKISCRRNAESLPGLPGDIYFGSDNLIIFVKLIMRLYRFYPPFVVGPRDYAVGKNDDYLEMFFPTIILIKISILC
jgi:hypothetical protein